MEELLDIRRVGKDYINKKSSLIANNSLSI